MTDSTQKSQALIVLVLVHDQAVRTLVKLLDARCGKFTEFSTENTLLRKMTRKPGSRCRLELIAGDHRSRPSRDEIDLTLVESVISVDPMRTGPRLAALCY